MVDINSHKKKKIYNKLGQRIEAEDIALLKEEYGYWEDAKLLIFWPEEDDFRDKDGFDKLFSIDNSYKKTIELKKGDLICRYGNENGSFTTVVGTPYEELGLPYDPLTIEYHEYEVVSDGVKVECCKVIYGKVAKAFESPGGAIQYKHFQHIMKELDDEKIVEVHGWKEKIKKKSV